MRVVIPDDYQDAVHDLRVFTKLDAHDVTIFHDSTSSIDELANRFADAEALVLIRERTEITEELLERLPKLKLISQTGRGTSHVDVASCTRRGITVSAGSGSPYAPAELTFALILAASRKITHESEALKQGRWQTTLGRTLRGRTLGIWGYGKIGALVASYAKAFGMHVVAWGREGSLTRADRDGHAAAPDANTLFQSSDVVSLHLRLSNDTRAIVKSEHLALMKPDSLLVNTSRAELIEPGALVAALRNGRPGFAAVDVYENEPAIDDPLISMPNVLCTPHLGYVEKDSYELYFGEAFDQVNAFAAGTPINVVK